MAFGGSKYLVFVALAVMLSTSCGGRNARKTETASVGEAAAPAVGEKQNGATQSDGAKNRSVQTSNAPSKPMSQFAYKVVKTYPHSRESYTQGLFWRDGYLYEGTGQNGKSALLKVDLRSGKALKSQPLDKRYFGEGITYHDGRIYQLTWQENKAFVYDFDTFKLLKTFTYKGEGWGITSDGNRLYMSDGTETIYVRNPETFEVERTMTVMAGRNRMRYLNELEWIDGEIWANVYGSDLVVIINPQTGRVTGMIDFGEIQAIDDVFYDTDVLNGIAYDDASGKIYVTGKNWNKLYQVEIIENK